MLTCATCILRMSVGHVDVQQASICAIQTNNKSFVTIRRTALFPQAGMVLQTPTSTEMQTETVIATYHRPTQRRSCFCCTPIPQTVTAEHNMVQKNPKDRYGRSASPFCRNSAVRRMVTKLMFLVWIAQMDACCTSTCPTDILRMHVAHVNI